MQGIWLEVNDFNGTGGKCFLWNYSLNISAVKETLATNQTRRITIQDGCEMAPLPATALADRAHSQWCDK